MYRTTIDFTGTQKLKDITVKSGSYSATYKMGIDDPSGTIPQADCQSETDMVYNFEFSIIDSDYYIQSVTFSQIPPSETNTGGSSISASAWSTAGIILESSGYQPLDLTDAQAPLQFIEKSKHLYAYTDSNTTPSTVYTDSTTLTTGMALYDNTGIDTNEVVINPHNDSFDNALSVYVNIWTADQGYITREDTIPPSTPPTNNYIYDIENPEIYIYKIISSTSSTINCKIASYNSDEWDEGGNMSYRRDSTGDKVIDGKQCYYWEPTDSDFPGIFTKTEEL